MKFPFVPRSCLRLLIGSSLGWCVVGCGSSPSNGWNVDPAGDLQINVADTTVDGTFLKDGRLVQFHATSEAQQTVVAFDIDGIPLEITVDFAGHVLIEDPHGSWFDFPHRALLLGLRDAIGAKRPDATNTMQGTFLAKAADRFAEVPIGRPMPRNVIPLTSGTVPIPVQSGCGGDGVSCLPGTSGSSWAVFAASGTCQASNTQYGDSVCRGRCGMGCNWFDNDYTWDCLDHDVCLDFSNDCDDEFTEAADDWVATTAPLCWSGSTRSMPPAVVFCGDAVIGVGEQCDDGNKIAGDGCSPTCTLEVPTCGNGKLEGTEQCDDGNKTTGDGCSATCTVEQGPTCGDGKLEGAEQCDDGNQAPGDGCSDTCTVEVASCGNGTLEAAEECDDGNTTGGDGCSPTCAAEGAHLVINEVEYDEVGTDTAEFVEIHNPTPNPVNLGNLALVFMNGANGVEYSRIVLSGILPAGGYLVVCAKGPSEGTCATGVAVPPGTLIANFALANNNIQNGAPDGVALVDLAGGTLVDALSYEGSLSGVITGLGTFNLVETTPVTLFDNGSSSIGMARLPNGSDTGDASIDWVLLPPTPGAANQ
jgi:cysteine-rich repeat protein